jgi:hypothetical protein
VCESCQLRLKAFAEAGVVDRIPYAAKRAAAKRAAKVQR